MKLIFVALFLVSCTLALKSQAGWTYRNVFTDDEVKKCTRLRTPSLVITNTGAAHVLARCCGKNGCRNDDAADGDDARLGDNDKDCTVVMKSSFDGGQSWENLQTLSPPGKSSFANANGVFDSTRNRIVVQFMYIPGGSTKPTRNVSYFQTTSSDDGKSWTPMRDITPDVSKCSTSVNDMMAISAGSKTQTTEGLMLFTGHDHGGNAVVWYSADGDRWTCSNRFPANEISVAQLYNLNNTVLINGRGSKRIQYLSVDGGRTWGNKSLTDLKGVECEGSLLSVGPVVYYTGPHGSTTNGKRSNMQIHCSKSNGQNWGPEYPFNGDAPGAYSDMKAVSGGNYILIVWEDHTVGNFIVGLVGTDWCDW